MIDPLANPQEATAVLFTGGSAHGLAAADGVVRWCEEHGRGYATPAGLVPLVPAAVIYDLNADPAATPPVRPGPRRRLRGLRGGRGPASPSAAASAPAAARRSRRRSAARRPPRRRRLRGDDDRRGRDGRGARRRQRDRRRARRRRRADRRARAARTATMLRSVEMFAAGHEPPGAPPERESTTLACVMTDAGLDKLACAKVARMASAGVARAVDPGLHAVRRRRRLLPLRRRPAARIPGS